MSTKIQKIEITNLKAIKNMVAVFDGCTAIVTGGNNKGKTTFLRGLPDRIRGEKPELIVKDGEEDGKGVLTLTTGERFEWEFSKTGAEKLIYVSKDNLKSQVTKSIAQKFFPELFDIDKFLQSTPKEQSQMLQKLAGVDFTELNEAFKLAFNERTIANRFEKETKSRLTNYNESLGLELLDESNLEQQIGGVTAHNELFKQMKKKLSETKERHEALLLELAELKKTIDKGEKWVNDEKNKPKDVEKLTNELEEVKKKNSLIRENMSAKVSVDNHKKALADAQVADDKVKEIERRREQLLREAKFPQGISLVDDQIFVDGFPLDKNQISTSKLYVTALRLASMNLGAVRTLHFDASPLDKNTLSEIEKWANENDCQLLIEKPDFEGGEIKYEIHCKQ